MLSYSYSRRLRNISYQQHRAQFSSVSHAAVQAHLDRLDQFGSHQAGSAASAVGLEDRLAKIALRGLNLLPTRLRLPIFNVLQKSQPAVRSLIFRTAWLRHKIQHVFRPSATAPVNLPQTFDLPHGAVYVSLGLDWNYKDMAQLYRIKQARGLKMLLFCYDIIPIRLPHLCVGDVSRQFAHYFTDLAWCADLILCISRSSQRDLTAFLQRMGAPLPRTEVVRLGADILPGQGQEGGVGEGITRYTRQPYILFVSTIERRKNHEVLYRAYTRLIDEGLTLPLLIFVGMSGWGVGELHTDLALDHRTQGLIHALNHVSDAELAHLYQHASFTVYPSLYEGWGLPVAESLAYGKFCLCSNTSSLPEVGEDWVEYLDPWDLPGWVNRLRHYITHPDDVAQRNAAIAAGYRPHPWRSTAQTIYSHAMRLHTQPAPADQSLLAPQGQ